MPDPLIVIGLKLEELVKPKVVSPSNLTVDPARSPERSTADPSGTAMFDKTISVQDFTAAEICAYSVQVQLVLDEAEGLDDAGEDEGVGAAVGDRVAATVVKGLEMTREVVIVVYSEFAVVLE